MPFPARDAPGDDLTESQLACLTMAQLGDVFIATPRTEAMKNRFPHQTLVTLVHLGLLRHDPRGGFAITDKGLLVLRERCRTAHGFSTGAN